MKRFFFIGYATLADAGFAAVCGWAFAFLADRLSSTGVDRSGTHTAATVVAGIDVLLLGLFAVHHSARARPAVRRLVSSVAPASMTSTETTGSVPCTEPERRSRGGIWPERLAIAVPFPRGMRA